MFLLESGTQRGLTLTSSLTRDSRFSEDWGQKGPEWQNKRSGGSHQTLGTTAEYKMVQANSPHGCQERLKPTPVTVKEVPVTTVTDPCQGKAAAPRFQTMLDGLVHI